MTMNISIQLHQAQRTILSDDHKYLVIDAGRQFGKSHVCAVFAIIMALMIAGGIGWIISPTYKQSGFLFKKVVDICKQCDIPIKVKKTPQDMSIYFEWTSSTIMALSADNKDNLRGATLDFLIFDEAAMVMDDSVWYEVLMPMCWKDTCKVRFISTPKGLNWFYDLFRMEEKDPDHWKSYVYTSKDNPFIPDEFITSMEKRLDHDTFSQEILGEFLSGGGMVFTDFEVKDVDGHLPQPMNMYCGAVDLAKTQDFTVITVANLETNDIVYVERWNGLSWEDTIAKIKDVYTLYNHCPLIIDATGVGDPIVERLYDADIDVTPFVFSGKTKPQLVRNLIAMLQAREIYVPNIDYYVDEIRRYAYYKTPEGNIKYSAPRGYHDDCVMSLGLLAWYLSQTTHEIGYCYDNTSEDKYMDFIVNLDSHEYDNLFEKPYEDMVKEFNRE